MSARAVPHDPINDVEEVVRRFPTLRQSLLSEYDNCPLSAYFSLRYGHGWSTSPQARGIILHRTFAEILRTMQRTGSRTIPIGEALAILIETCRQQDIPSEDIVRVPLRQMPELRMATRKFAADNQFSVEKIVSIERRLQAPITYTRPDGQRVTRTLTGQLDALLFDPPDGAICLDWKTGHGLPPEPRDAEPRGYDDEELKGLSYLGYFQQRFYGLLVMTGRDPQSGDLLYPSVQRVTLREFWTYRTQARKAVVHRHQLPEIEEELGVLVEAFDNAVAQGAPNLRPGSDGLIDIDALGWWRPAPGKHCSLCLAPTRCPIPSDVRVAAGGAITTENDAEIWAARLLISDRIRKAALEGLKGWSEGGNPPTPVKWAKGRAVIGWYQTKRGRRFGIYTPDESDRGGHADIDRQLEEAMREATAKARRERGVQPRRRRRRVGT